jgi:hypothetical protein
MLSVNKFVYGKEFVGSILCCIFSTNYVDVVAQLILLAGLT